MSVCVSGVVGRLFEYSDVLLLGWLAVRVVGGGLVLGFVHKTISTTFFLLFVVG